MNNLINAKEVAAKLGVSPRQVTERLVTAPGFPRPIRIALPGCTRKGHPKWRPEEIEAWIETQRA